MRRSKAPSNRLIQTSFEANKGSPPQNNLHSQTSSESVDTKDDRQSAEQMCTNESKTIYNVVWGQRTTKKHKTFQNDGTLEVCGKQTILKDGRGAQVGLSTQKWETIEIGMRLVIGSNEVEISEHVSGPIINHHTQIECIDGSNQQSETKAPSNRLTSASFSTKKRVSLQEISISRIHSADTNNVVQSTELPSASATAEDRTIYKVVWGQRTTKKHKTFQNDGTLEFHEKQTILKDANGSQVGLSTQKWDNFEIGMRLVIGSNEVEIIEHISGPIIQSMSNVAYNKRRNSENSLDVANESKRRKKPTNPSVFVPMLDLSSGSTTTHRGILQNNDKLTVNFEYKPLVLPAPSESHQSEFNAFGTTVKNVTVMGSLARELRPHQREGVIFMYECLMGYRQFNEVPYFGCILADEMGLGKTLQCITTCYTLLKQSPYDGGSVANKILIVTPSSLVENWNIEIRKWLGRERAYTFQIDSKQRPHHFAVTNHIPFLIISYEMLAKSFEELERVRFDIIVCDEGHRLKNSNIKAALCLDKFPCKRRIILTGTPIQNDLQEFYSLINFVNPGLLGEYSQYKRKYETPIVQSQQPNAARATREHGAERAQELNEITKSFVLRRTQEVNNKYLPPKQEFVVFCKPSELQEILITKALEFYEEKISNRGHGGDITPFHIITILKKICNHPSLLCKISNGNSLINYVQQFSIPWYEMSEHDSGKLAIVRNMLHELIVRKEKIVLVSYYTKTLNLFQELMDHYKYNYCRLDGTTQTANRAKIVERFNDKSNDTFVFLLSAKAGGVGLNLTGASRLILYDNDWNPSSDLQAMSRIWRDGQKKSVYIYRLVTNGTIEEKIFQRQVSKTSLSSCVVDQRNADNTPKLSNEELKDLFTIQKNYDDCSTHDLLNCNCSGDGTICTDTQSPSPINNEAAKSIKMNELMLWEHHAPPIYSDLLEEMCLSESTENIAFIFRNLCNTSK